MLSFVWMTAAENTSASRWSLTDDPPEVCCLLQRRQGCLLYTSIKSIKSKITDLDKMKIEEQKKAVRSGYDMDIIPSDLATFGGEAKRLLQDLQTRNERLFLVTILIMNTATSRQKLENALCQTAAIAQKYNLSLIHI